MSGTTSIDLLSVRSIVFGFLVGSSLIVPGSLRSPVMTVNVSSLDDDAHRLDFRFGHPVAVFRERDDGPRPLHFLEVLFSGVGSDEQADERHEQQAHGDSPGFG